MNMKKWMAGVSTLALSMALAGAAFTYGTLTNAVTAAGGISNATSFAASQAVNLIPGAPLLLSPNWSTTNNLTTTYNTVFGIDLYNGQSWTTIVGTNAPALCYTNAPQLGGTNTVGYWVISAASLAGASQFRWDFTFTTGSNQVTGIQYQQQY